MSKDSFACAAFLCCPSYRPSTLLALKKDSSKLLFMDSKDEKENEKAEYIDLTAFQGIPKKVRNPLGTYKRSN